MQLFSDTNVFRTVISTQANFFIVAMLPNAGYGLLIHEVSTSHTTTHQSR